MNVMPPKGEQAAAPRTRAAVDPAKIDRATATESDAAGERFGDLMEIDRAWLLMLAEAGIIPRADARAMARALITIDREFDPGSPTEAASEAEGSFSPIDPELRWRLGSDNASQLQVGRSRSDIGQTLSRMRLKAETDELGARLRSLIGAMIEIAARESRTIILTYRDGQPLLPTTWGHYLAGTIETLLRDAARLNEARRLIDLCPMGAADATSTGFAVDRARLASLLGFAAAARNSYGAILSVDYVMAGCSALELIALNLGRPLRDLRHWTSFDVAQFRDTAAAADGSPHGTLLEEAAHLLSQAAGKARAATEVPEAAWFADAGQGGSAETETVCEAFAAAGRALDLLAGFLQHIEVDAGRTNDAIRRSCATLGELSDSVVRLEGLSPRRAADLAARLARDVRQQNGGLDEAAYPLFASAFAESAGRKTKIAEDEFAELVSPQHVVAVRERLGGPAASAMGDAITALRAELRLLVEAAEAIRKREAAAAVMLDDRFRALAEGR
jgi:argininosuccinate lyase